MWTQPGEILATMPRQLQRLTCITAICAVQRNFWDGHIGQMTIFLFRSVMMTAIITTKMQAAHETYDPEQIRQVLTQDVNAGRQKTELYFARQEDYDRAVQDLVNGSLVKEAMQNTSVLQPGQGISWNIYSGGQDRLLVLVWRP